jgi:hypothetical protein
MGIGMLLFGPSRKDIWRKLSEQVGGQVVSRGFWRGEKVEVRHESWILTLDTYTVSTGKATMVFTRMRAPYVNPSGFRFRVYRKSIFTGLGKLLGMQDIEIGDPPFDHELVVQSADEAKVRHLLSNVRLRDLVAAQPSIRFEVKDDEGWFGATFPEGVDELYFSVHGVIKDIERLKLLYELFAETLDHLCRLDLASPEAPGVGLR